MITRFREWLERNKIFFEIIVALSLTAMSIIISYNANQIATDQNNLIKEENQPIFIFNVTHFNNDLNNSSNEVEKLDIYNIGGPAYNCSIEEYTFFNIQFSDFEGNLRNSANIPMAYYSGITFTGLPTGLMKSFLKNNYVIINGKKCPTEKYTVLNQISNDLYTYLQNHNSENYSKENGDLEVDLLTYVLITYIDIYGENHDEIYYVSDGISFKLSEYDKICLTKEYNKRYVLYHGPLDLFAYMPPEEVIKLLSNYSSSEAYVPPHNYIDLRS